MSDCSSDVGSSALQLSGNRLESDNLPPGVKKRPDRLVSPAELEEIIDNSCAQYFLFALYAIIPVQELIDIDLKKPMTFSSAAVASYNPFSGTFHEVRVNRPITVTPKDGELRSGDRKSTRLNSSHECASRMPSSA